MKPITAIANPVPVRGEFARPAVIDARFAFIPRLHSWDDRSLLCQPAFIDGQVRAARYLSGMTDSETTAGRGSRSSRQTTKH